MLFLPISLWKNYLRKMRKGRPDRIWEALRNWILFPSRIKNELRGAMPEKSTRQLLIDNYIAIFRIDEESKTVHVVTIQYQGRDL